MDKKTFLELLSELEPNTKLNIGTDSGSSWLWIETADTLLEHIGKLDDVLRDYAKSCLDKAQDRMDSLPTEIVKLQSKVFVDGSLNRKDVCETETKLHVFEQKYYEAYKQRRKYQRYLTNYVPVKNREVISVEDHTIDTPGFLVKIKGNEDGYLWLDGEKVPNNPYAIN